MEWKKQEDRLEVTTWCIVQTRKKDGRWDYREVEAGFGDWSELVYVLYEDYMQFGTDVETGKNKHTVLDEIAKRLEKQDQPYEFKLPDKTDNWYYAYSKPAIYRVDHEGKLG